MLVAVSASVWFWLWHNFYTCEKLAQVHHCAWGLQWKIMIVQRNKWVALNAVMTSYLFVWPSALYLLSLCCTGFSWWMVPRHMSSMLSWHWLHFWVILNCTQPRGPLMHVVTRTCSRVWSWASSRRSFLTWGSRRKRGEQVYTRQRRII